MTDSRYMVDSRSLGGATAPGLGIIVIAQRERERESGGGRRGSHQWCHLEAELRR
jgi:hypothetical protein